MIAGTWYRSFFYSLKMKVNDYYKTFSEINILKYLSLFMANIVDERP